MFHRLHKIEGNTTSLSHCLRKIWRSESNSGPLRSAAARNPENASAEIGPEGAGERDLRRESARKRGRGLETGGQQILAQCYLLSLAFATTVKYHKFRRI